MATQQEQPAKAAAVAKVETFVQEQLVRATSRVRKLDVAAAVLVFLSGTLLYALAMASADLVWHLSSEVRRAALLAYVSAATVYLGINLFLFWRRRVNPYFAARQLERTVADAKGSLINWLDLHDHPLPPAIRATLGTRAARDVRRAEVEEAISGRRNLLLTALLIGLAVGVAALFIANPGRFGPLLARTFAPFTQRGIPANTALVLLEPEGGDLTVPVGRKVHFRVQVQGRIPPINQADSVRLLYRYNRSDPYAELPLEPDPDGDWTAVFLPDQVQNGFWYLVAGGDAQTREYQVAVRSSPQVVRFDVTYHYRPYLRLPDRTAHFPNDKAVFPAVKDYRGTEVTLTLKTNRLLQHGNLEIDGDGQKRLIAGQVLSQDSESFRCRFVLERSGAFRIRFQSRDAEANTDTSAYPIDVIEDRTPRVELFKPGQDVALPANGVLRLEGSAADDQGIKQLALRIRVAKGTSRPSLAPKVYLAGKSLRLVNGKYPDQVAYKDFLLLDKLQGEAARAVPPLAPGTELEYWLEATDNCDYPSPQGNVGRSKKYRVTIGQPEKDKKKQEQQRAAAEAEQRKQEQQQVQDLDRRNREAQQQEQQQKEPVNTPDARAQEQDKQFEKKAQDLEEKLNQSPNDPGQNGQAKGSDSGPPVSAAKEGRPQQDPKAKDANAAGQPKPDGASAPKNAGAKGAKPPPMQAKDAGGDPDDKGQPGDAKGGAGKLAPNAGAKGAGPEAGQSVADSKKGPPGAAQPQAGSAKAGQDPGSDGRSAPNAGKAKEAAKTGQAADSARAGASKPAGKEAPAQVGAKPADPGRAGAKASQAQTKGGPDQGPATAKDTRPDNAGDAAQAKQGAASAAPGTASAKGQDSTAPRAAAKGNGAGGQQAVSSANSRGPGAAGSRPGVAQPKDGPQGGVQGAAAKAGPGEGKGPGLGDVARARQEGLGSSEARQRALEKLKRIEQAAPDAKVREAARQAAQELAQVGAADPRSVPGSGAAKDGGQSAPPAQARGTDLGPAEKLPENANAKQGERSGPGEPGSSTAKNTMAGKNKTSNNAQAKGPGGGMPTGQRAAGPGDENQPSPANVAAARRGGALSLEEWKKKLTPERLKELNWTEKDRAQFLKEAQAYLERLRRQQAAAPRDKLAGTKSLLPGSSAREVGKRNNVLRDPLDSLHVLPPPEFRDAHERFTAPRGKVQPPGDG